MARRVNPGSKTRGKGFGPFPFFASPARDPVEVPRKGSRPRQGDFPGFSNPTLHRRLSCDHLLWRRGAGMRGVVPSPKGYPGVSTHVPGHARATACRWLPLPAPPVSANRPASTGRPCRSLKRRRINGCSCPCRRRSGHCCAKASRMPGHKAPRDGTRIGGMPDCCYCHHRPVRYVIGTDNFVSLRGPG